MRKNLLIALLTALPLFATELTPIELTLKELTLEEKVGQLMMAHFNGTTANRDAKELIEEVGIGGIIYYNWANGLTSPKQVRDLSHFLQKLAAKTRTRIPLFIAVDQEGGAVAMLEEGFTHFPGNKALGMTGDPALAGLAAQAMGEELRAVGINMNFAPVVDVNSQPNNPVIGLRSFGEDPHIVTEFGTKALEGYKKASIITTLKHFPGHGDVEIDSHHDLPVVNKSMEEFEKMELVPFRKMAKEADAVMTAHIIATPLDKDNCTTLSEKSLSFLTQELNFQGLIVTDSLIMAGVLKKPVTVDEAAILALQAGSDLLLLGGKRLIAGQPTMELTVDDIKRIHQSIVAAVKSGRISQDRIDHAVDKILALKERYLDPSLTAASIDISISVKTKEHQELARKIATLALRTNKKEIESLEEKDIVFFAPQILQNSLDETSMTSLGKTRNFCFYSDLNPRDDMRTQAEREQTGSNLLIVFAYDAWNNPAQKKFIDYLFTLEKPVILIVVRGQQDAALFPKADLIITTHSTSIPSLQAVADLLGATP